jgi:hypothetical protein
MINNRQNYTVYDYITYTLEMALHVAAGLHLGKRMQATRKAIFLAPQRHWTDGLNLVQ